MIKTFTCILALLLTAGLAGAQTIDEIQQYNAETGEPESPYDGQNVTVTGVVYVIGGTYNGGTHYIQGATGGISFFASGTGLEIGDLIELSGTVGSWGGEIQIENPSPAYDSSPGEPTPTPATPTEILSDYEWVGNFVAVTGIVTSKDGNSEFTLEADGEEDLIIYIDSDTGIDIGAVDVGDEYLVKSPVVVYNGLIELKPRMQSDLVEDPGGDTLPVISNISLANYAPTADMPIVISALIEDNSAVADAYLYYRNSDGETPDAWSNMAMADTGGDIWEATIPAGHTGSQVDYYIEATDDGAQTVTLPGDAPASYYEVAVGFTRIFDLQYVDPNEEDQTTPYFEKVLNIKGVITAGTGEAGAASKFILQTQEPDPVEGYRWGGVLVYEGTASGEYYRGDVVEIGGYGDEYNGLSEMIPHNGDAIDLISFGGELPLPERATTRVLADNTLEDGNGKLGEAYESVWVKTYAAMVIETGEYDEFLISDTEARADSCEVEPAVELTYVPTVGNVIYVEGYMDFSYGAFQVTPISDDFVTLTEWTAVEDTPSIETAGGFKAIYPNPFNPVTKIAFKINHDELTQLNVYNIRGELVRSLVNEQLPMGDYEMTWDGRDDRGQSLASGQYFARLRIGSTVMQVRKLSLVK